MHSAFPRHALAAPSAAAVLTSAAWSQTRDDALFGAATAEQPAVVRTLERLVNIEAGTGDAEGFAAAGKYLEDELNADVRCARNEGPGFGYHSDQAEYEMIDAIPRRPYLASKLIMDLGASK